MKEPPPAGYALVQDAALRLAVDGRCAPLVGSWLPLNAEPIASLASARASVSVRPLADAAAVTAPRYAPTLRVGGVSAWIEVDTESVLLLGSRDASGSVDLACRSAVLHVFGCGSGEVTVDLHPMLTIACALLLGRIERLLLHAGAVVADDGRAWLVVGDARSGKSTTCLSLAAAGWGLLSDDQVVLHADSGWPKVEGWLRPLHLDDGWNARAPTGVRRPVQPSDLAVDVLRGPVVVAGTLHTSVTADQATSVSAISASEAFVGFVRQSPWLLADRAVAPRIVEALSTLSRLPRFAVRLGPDTFGDPAALRDLLTSNLRTSEPS